MYRTVPSTFFRVIVGTVIIGMWSTIAGADNLRDVYELALRNDPTIRAAEATYKAGLEAEKLGRSALLPQVNASAEYGASNSSSQADNPIGGSLIPSNAETDSTSNIWGVSLDQRVFDLPTWFGFTRGKELTRQAEAQFAADQQALIVRVAEDYFGVLRALDNLNASRAQERANQRQLEQTQQRFDVGLIAITDVHEARAAYDLSRATRLSDEGNLGVSLERLSVLTGRRHDNIWLLKEDYPVVDPDPMEKEEWVNFALDNNYTVKASAYARDAANQSAKARKAEHYPKVSARLGYQDSRTYSDMDLEEVGQLDDGTWILTGNTNSFDNVPNARTGASATLNLTVPLYSGGFISASRRQAYQEFNRAQENYSGAVRTTIQTTRALHLQTTVDVATTNARKLAITSTQSAYDATQAGYEVGTRNIVDVLNVQQALFSALRDYANARYKYVIDMLKLKNQAGLISPRDVNELNQWLIPPEAPTLSKTGLTQ